MLYLMRHAETDWTQVNKRRWAGLANDFAPLTDLGRQQAADAASHVARLQPSILLTSPMTRAMETAAIIGRRIGIDPTVDIDLREWLPDKSMTWSSSEDVQAAFAAMIDSAGRDELPTAAGWETLSEVRSRALGALRPFIARDGTALAVCHGVLIHAVTGHPDTGHCQIRAIPGVE
jgi:broad specificity phosphatase PhoE